MKTNFLKSILALAFFAIYLIPALAQSPEKMSYQAVIRNSNDELIKNAQVGMQITILQYYSNGTVVYMETQTPITNENGLVSINIGDRTVLSGDFASIDWSKGPYYIKTETDPAGGTNYCITLASQFLSVPYALYAKTAENIKGGITETDPIFAAWNKSTGISITESQISDLGNYIETETDPVFKSSQAFKITSADITKLSNLSGVNTGDQDLSALATKIALKDSIAQLRSKIPPAANGSETKIIAGNNVIITGSGTTENPYIIKTKTYKVGDFAHGGIVFYVDETGEHGLVCAKKDQSNSAMWYAGTYKRTMAKGYGINSGAMNTAIIIASQGEGDRSTYAARICNELQVIEGGRTYGGWYLPSLNELKLMCENKAAINATALANGGNSFNDGWYWCSCEHPTNAESAWDILFSSCYDALAPKNNTCSVRAIRAF